MDEPVAQTVDDLLEEKGKTVQESIDILQPLIRNFFIREGYTYPDPEDDGYVDSTVSDKYLRLHFNMVELARYHNLTSLLSCMIAIGKVHTKFQSWLEMMGGQVGKECEEVLEVYETECINIYSYCLDIPCENLLENRLTDREINQIRRAVGKIIESFENLQHLRTKYVTLDYHDNESDVSTADYLRDLDVDWKELVKARELLPKYRMLESQSFSLSSQITSSQPPLLSYT